MRGLQSSVLGLAILHGRARHDRIGAHVRRTPCPILVDVFREVRRVLRKDGTVWLNYGDAYSGGWRTAYPTDDLDGHPRPGREHKNRRVWPMGLKPKDLMFMPARVGMALQAAMAGGSEAKIIWHKPNPDAGERDGPAHVEL